MSHAEITNRCVLWLNAQGFEVLHVPRGECAQPRITIKLSPLCDRLEGVARAYERNVNGARHYKFVIRHGCNVEWDIEVERARWNTQIERACRTFAKCMRWVMGGAA